MFFGLLKVSFAVWRSVFRRPFTFVRRPTSTLNETSKLKQELAELTAELEGKKSRGSSLVSVLGFSGALVLLGAFIDETTNTIVGLHSSTWDVSFWTFF